MVISLPASPGRLAQSVLPWRGTPGACLGMSKECPRYLYEFGSSTGGAWLGSQRWASQPGRGLLFGTVMPAGLTRTWEKTSYPIELSRYASYADL